MNNLGEIGTTLINAAIRKAEELGEENVMAVTYEAICIAKRGYEDLAMLLDILGPERMGDFAEFLMKSEAESAINEAEGFLREGGE